MTVRGTPEAVFIGGCPRSGTTLLGSLLGGLQDCTVTPESQFKQTLLDRLQSNPSGTLSNTQVLDYLQNYHRFRQWGINIKADDLPPQLDEPGLRLLLLKLASRFGAVLDSESTTSTWIDHTPMNIEYGLRLANLFPNSRFIHLVRDPRAIAASLLPLDWGPKSPAGIAELWIHRLAHGLALEVALMDRVKRVHFEDLCSNPETVLRDLTEWLQLRPPEVGSILQPVSSFLPRFTLRQHQLIGELPQAERISAWRLDLERWQLRELESRLDELMRVMGYNPENVVMETGERRPGVLRRHLLPGCRRVLGRLRHRWHKHRHT